MQTRYMYCSFNCVCSLAKIQLIMQLECQRIKIIHDLVFTVVVESTEMDKRFINKAKFKFEAVSFSYTLQLFCIYHLGTKKTFYLQLFKLHISNVIITHSICKILNGMNLKYRVLAEELPLNLLILLNTACRARAKRKTFITIGGTFIFNSYKQTCTLNFKK